MCQQMHDTRDGKNFLGWEFFWPYLHKTGTYCNRNYIPPQTNPQIMPTHQSAIVLYTKVKFISWETFLNKHVDLQTYFPYNTCVRNVGCECYSGTFSLLLPWVLPSISRYIGAECCRLRQISVIYKLASIVPRVAFLFPNVSLLLRIRSKYTNNWFQP